VTPAIATWRRAHTRGERGWVAALQRRSGRSDRSASTAVAAATVFTTAEWSRLADVGRCWRYQLTIDGLAST
jgi:hypothetical protein